MSPNDNQEEILRRIDEEFRFYRQLGLGLSATILALSGVMFKAILEKLTFPLAHSCTTVFWFLALTMSVVAAICVQLCQYMGYQHMARRYFPPKNIEPSVWSKERWESGNCWFTACDWSVWISVLGVLLGFFASAYLWRYL